MRSDEASQIRLLCYFFFASSINIRRFSRTSCVCGWSVPKRSSMILKARRKSVIALANLDRITQWARNILTSNHAAFNTWLQSRSEVQTITPNFGTVVFPSFKNGSVDELCSLLQEKYSTAIVPGKFFEMPNHFRIGLGCEPQTLEAGLKNISAALDELNSSSTIIEGLFHS